MTAKTPRSHCRVTTVSPTQAKSFLAEQEVDNPCLIPEVLEDVCQTVDWWLATWRGNPICLWPICKTSDTGGFKPPSLLNYIGPTYSPALLLRPIHRQYRICHSTMTMLLRKISQEYPNFQSELHPELIDIRPALWFSDQSGHLLKLSPRYTAMLNISPQRSIDDLAGGFARNRRRDLKTLSGSDKPLKAQMHLADAFQLYLEQLASKDARQLALSREQEFLSILSAAENGRGFILKYRVGAESLSGFICCLKGTRTAAAVVMASTETAKRRGLPAWMILEAIKTARELGLGRFDFTGANSPLGATEKHGYGAVAQLHFAMCFNHSTDVNETYRPEACE